MKNARYIIWNAVILISILFSSSEILGQTDLELKQHLINGMSSFEDNMNEDAANSFSKGSTLENYEDIAAYNLGRSLMETEDLEGATSAFKQAIASSENNELISNAWYNSGNIALNSNDPSSAVEAYKSSLRLNPNFSNARHNLAIANKMLQQQEEEEKEQEQEGEDEQEGEQEDKGEEGNEEEEEKQVAGQISKEEMARILESLDQEEERIMSKLRMQKGDGTKKTIEKPW